ncbi:septal ring lytic transglycosylase RlpA family protein [Sediminispirochaeta smaragdinae]|jgi:rare lipoprotein A|uniref:Probable endolytic peptidoglycan transglycosylase RlpA n=1 Tax=Sediminispirochaeta smaragdinae (strain DSM 11293 / JCM 15392 / SEBR 4228) TaxID=573413 RepID=E1RBG7_SEDSS|nr:septal ring lytic transglycosylase RlpA family protein [Sediminispirochaeta smaragdinae]ADK79697.1 rare lipoprotein A [Sediminispirochaeta smaragdinae DSM 11293]
MMQRAFFPSLLLFLLLFPGNLFSQPRVADIEAKQVGFASWYGGKFQGRKTANGEVFDTNKLTAAHKTLPFGTLVRVTNLDNDKSVEVRINDRGPFVEGRIIDLSRAAAEAIDMVGRGIAKVSLEVIGEPPGGVPQDLYRRHEKNATVTIQVASFGLRENAERTHTLLAGRGISASIETAPTGHYRVVVPHVASSELEAVRKTLSELGYPSVLIRE